MRLPGPALFSGQAAVQTVTNEEALTQDHPKLHTRRVTKSSGKKTSTASLGCQLQLPTPPRIVSYSDDNTPGPTVSHTNTNDFPATYAQPLRSGPSPNIPIHPSPCAIFSPGLSAPAPSPSLTLL